MATRNTPKEESAKPAAPGQSRTLLIVVVVLVILLAVGGAAAAWLLMGRQPAAAAPAPAHAVVSSFLPIEQFTVNLQPEEGAQFLQVSLTLQLSGSANVDLIKSRMPDIRNRLLLLLSSHRASELMSMEAKKKLADDLLNEIRNSVVPGGANTGIDAVLYTAFIIQ